MCRAKIAVNAYRENAQANVDAKAKEKVILKKLDHAQRDLEMFQKRESRLQHLRRENNDMRLKNMALQAARDQAIKK